MKRMTNDELLARLDERFEAQKEKLQSVYEEVKKTNGRVTDLEKSRERNKGAVAVISALFGGASAFVIKLFS